MNKITFLYVYKRKSAVCTDDDCYLIFFSVRICEDDDQQVKLAVFDWGLSIVSQLWNQSQFPVVERKHNIYRQFLHWAYDNYL